MLEQNKVNNADNPRKKCKELINNKKLILKSQERFRSERYNAYSEQLNKVASGPSGKKEMQSINSTEIFAYRTSKCKLCKKEETNIEIQ